MLNLKSTQAPLEPWRMEDDLIIFLPFLFHPLPSRVLTSTSVSSSNTVICPSRRAPNLLMVLKTSVPTRTYLTSVIPEFKSSPGVRGSHSLHNYLRFKFGTNLPEEHSTVLDCQKLLSHCPGHIQSQSPHRWNCSGLTLDENSINISNNALGRG